MIRDCNNQLQKFGAACGLYQTFQWFIIALLYVLLEKNYSAEVEVAVLNLL